MTYRMNHMAHLCLLILFVGSSISWAGPGHAQQPMGEASVTELEELLGVVEDPEKRSAFVKDLKGLIKAKRALDDQKGADDTGGESRQLWAIRWVFERFEQVSSGVKNAAVAMDHMIERVPEVARRGKTFLFESQNRSRIHNLIMNAGTAMAIAVISGFFLSRPVRAARRRMKDLPSRIGWGFLYVFWKGFPYLILCVAFAGFFALWPSFPAGRTVVLLFFGLLFCYRIVSALFQVLLSPDDARLRILSVSDENAHYLWIWIRRFACYAFFYFLATRAFLWTHTAQDYFVHLRGLLLLPFPVMLTVFILQAAREMRIKREQENEAPKAVGTVPKSGRSRLTKSLIPYWPILALVYTWVIFLTLMIQYEKGVAYLVHATLGTGVTCLIMLLCFRFLDAMFRRLFRVNERISRQFPGLEERANRYVMFVKKGVVAAVAIIGSGVIGEIWGIPVSEFVASETGGRIILRSVAIIITLAVVVSIIEAANALSAYLLREIRRGRKRAITQKQKTLIPVIRTAINISAGFVGGIIVLDRLGVNTTPILAGAGIVGLAVGFGSQTLVKDLINGLFILFEESIRVGDWATVGNQGGMVESVGLRTVKLRDLNGTVHVIPNSTIDSLSNYSKHYSRTVMDIGIAYREDVDEVMEILKDLGAELEKDPEYGPSILEPLEIFGLDRFEDSAVIIRARFKTRPLQQWSVRREFYRRMKRTFDERGIEIPFPHQTIYMGEPKKGKAPPLFVSVDRGPEGEGPLAPTPADLNGDVT